MPALDLLALLGLALGAWGHCILNDVRGAAASWTRVDERFPLALQSPAPVAGGVLLLQGALCVLMALTT